jgi:hypothetical protein
MTISRQYTIFLDPDFEDGGYTVTVTALPGIVTQGETVAEAIAMANGCPKIQFVHKRLSSTLMSLSRLRSDSSCPELRDPRIKQLA